MRLQPKALDAHVTRSGHPTRPVRLVVGGALVLDITVGEALELADRFVDIAESQETP